MNFDELVSMEFFSSEKIEYYFDTYILSIDFAIDIKIVCAMQQ